MSSKEEILKENGINGDIKNLYPVLDQYAKQECMAFAEWIDGNGYGCFLMTDEGEKHWDKLGDKKVNVTTADLYTLYLQQK